MKLAAVLQLVQKALLEQARQPAIADEQEEQLATLRYVPSEHTQRLFEKVNVLLQDVQLMADVHSTQPTGHATHREVLEL